MSEAAVIYSIAGLCIGFIIGRWFHLEFYGEVKRLFRRRKSASAPGYDPHAPLPEAIPLLTFDRESGEPFIAREEVHHPSPIPRSITIMVVILACLTVAYLFWQKQQDLDTVQRANDRLTTQVKDNAALLQELKHQQGLINGNEQRLEDLVLAISTAKTPGEVTAAIQRFLKSSAQAQADEEKYQREHGGQGSSTTQPSGDTRGSPSPRSSPTARPSNGPQPSSSPSPGPSPSTTPKPSPSSSSPPVQVCVATPLGQVCEPPAWPLLLMYLFV